MRDVTILKLLIGLTKFNICNLNLTTNYEFRYKSVTISVKHRNVYKKKQQKVIGNNLHINHKISKYSK